MYSIINYSLRHKAVVLLFVLALIGVGIHALVNIPIGAVPDITNNQVQVITTSRNLATEEVERFLTAPVELEMSNLPGVKEIRSISKFGLSVVTVVFDDDMGTYLPRQLIAEKLTSISEDIPDGFGSPSMGPISTGLGEIYQYTLDVKPDYQDRYDVADLRTIQDWIVKRQLTGIPGVVEVNTWGGFLKTYEVAIHPSQLQSLNLSLEQVYDALEANNSVAGGGYIEKSNQAYFIRADGMARTLSDIENIVVGTVEGTPIYIKDIGSVGIGSATRFGAITGNGEGEKVLGQVMMLKGADSKKVIDAVIDRVAAIQQSLPPGVYINPFLERSELIGKTTFTIAENLILGFLIVLFVVVFLMGNWRSGIVVASIIPLTLLFALSMMYYFGIDANLMSLGAIDFGIIIDGAIIVVEYVTYQITQNKGALLGLQSSAYRDKIDHIVAHGASKMMHSAFFGQIIIIIVFIPILTLSGVEGKMFRPMALTFCFALIGAMVLCFTYVPVVSSLLLKPVGDESTLSSRFVDFLRRIYQPILTWSLQSWRIVLASAIGLFVATVLLFSQMGGEFVPTLDEGDFVIQPVLKTGMSLEETVKMTTRIERIVKTFPEVKQVVSRIGAAEVPTDPMSMEESDVIITLNKKSSWTTAETKDELANALKTRITQEIPGIEIEFTQPIEMRFNELISGARADLAIKLFGEDLDILYTKANEIEQAISGVEGAADITIEKIDGLPEMTVQYDRQKMARYGVNISQLNDVIAMGFAGKKAGVIFEGEKKFDLVVRYDEAHRGDIDHLRNARITLPSGDQIPLSAFAAIDYGDGPAKISRDDTHRRVVIGVNVRGRDLQSVVDEVQGIINSQVALPPGYNIQYGGQFENLQKASRRLLIAVPFALALIFILLYFAFGSTREALLIYSAIPLATIGGVLALYLRGMPFSISAGIGFIALFGIAVLNGIVLIEHFDELKENGMKKLDYLIVSGALDRLRPVLLTAFAAALGFLPMAVSSSAGAEVQRPLATVVIGGLISSTLLTLLILPILYSKFSTTAKHLGKTTLLAIALLTVVDGDALKAQSPTLDLEDLIELSLQNNMHYQSSRLQIDRAQALIGGAKEIGKTEFYYGWDSNNLTLEDQSLHVLGVNHSFKLPSYHRSKQSLQTSKYELARTEADLVAHQLKGAVSQLYDDIWYAQAIIGLYHKIDSIYTVYSESVRQKASLGASNRVELLAVQQRQEELHLALRQAEWDAIEAKHHLQQEINTNAPLSLATDVPYQQLDLPTSMAPAELQSAYYDQLSQVASQQEQVYQKEAMPEINAEVFNGLVPNNASSFYPGLQVGVALPLSKKQYSQKAKAAQIDQAMISLQKEKYRTVQDNKREQLVERLTFLSQQLEQYYQTTARTSNQLAQTARSAMDGGQMDYLEYLLIIESTTKAKRQELDLIHQYNQTLLSLNYQTK